MLKEVKPISPPGNSGRDFKIFDPMPEASLISRVFVCSVGIRVGDFIHPVMFR